MAALVVGAFVKGFAKHGPLEGEVRQMIGIHGAIHTPSRRDMIEDHVLRFGNVERIARGLAFIA